MLAAFGHSVWSQTIPLVVFSYNSGYFGDGGSSSSGTLDNVSTFASYNVKNAYFTNVTNGATSNNIVATAVFELSDGSEISVQGFIYARHTSGSTIVGLLWKPNQGVSVNINGFTVSNAVGGATSNGICVQLIGQTVTVSNGNDISGNSGNLTLQDLINYANSYPNVFTNSTVSNVISSSVNWGGYLGSSSTAYTFSKAGIAYSPLTYTNGTPNQINVDPASGSQTKSEMVSSNTTTTANATYNFSGTTSGLAANTKYYFRAYVVYGSQTYQGPLESFTTCPDAPTGTGATICSGATASISATGVSGGTLTWHTAATGGTQLGTGASYTTAALTNSGASNTTTTYYVQDANSSCPSTRTAVTVTVKPVTTINTTCNLVHTCAKNASSTITTNVNQSGSGSYIWYNTASSTNSGGTTVSGFNGVTTNTFVVPTSNAGIFYYYYTLNDGCGTKTSPVHEVVVYDRIWNGGSSSTWETTTNWTPNGAVAATDVLVIPAVSTFPTISSTTINSGGAIVVLDDAQLTLTGTLTNNGTLMINSGATFVYTNASPFSGSGNYVLKQNITGANVLFSGTYQPSGRYWYMGVPFNQQRSVFGIDPTATAADGPNSCRVWEWNEAASGGANWTSTLSSSATMTPTKGYLVRTGATCKTIGYTIAGSSGNPYTGDLSVNVTRQSGVGQLDGFNLISNPYPAYIDAGDLSISASSGLTGQSSNIATTIWIRTVNQAGTAMVYDHFLATNPSASTINSQSNSQNAQNQLRYIAPYQAFWVRVNSGNATGTVTFPRSSMTHYANGTGLKNIQDFKAFVRMNLAQGNKSDQMVVYMDHQISNGFDKYDAEKMFLSGVPQVYTKSGSNKLAVNGINDTYAKTAVPVIVEIPSPSVYFFNFIDHHIDNGKVYLEDKQLDLMIDLDMSTSYQFFSVSGVVTDRFVLHFARFGVPGIHHSIVDEIADPEYGYNENVNIKCIANQGVEITRPTEDLTPGSIQIFDNTGRLVYQSAFNDATHYCPITNGAGVYLVNVMTGTSIKSKKVVIQ